MLGLGLSAAVGDCHHYLEPHLVYGLALVSVLRLGGLVLVSVLVLILRLLLRLGLVPISVSVSVSVSVRI